MGKRKDSHERHQRWRRAVLARRQARLATGSWIARPTGGERQPSRGNATRPALEQSTRRNDETFEKGAVCPCHGDRAARRRLWPRPIGRWRRWAGAGEPIVVGGVFDLSGITADIGTPYAEGVRDYVDWRNAQGGLSGRLIDLRWQDYRYQVPISEQLYTQFVSEGAVAFQGWGTGDTEALRSKISEDEIPFMSRLVRGDAHGPRRDALQLRGRAQLLQPDAPALQYIAVFHSTSTAPEAPPH
ncbi:MAG: ABC transporter substrate-binding protein [Egibacteraceae bacterium]